MDAWPAMTDMSGIPMPGGWRMSALWLPMCGRSWLGAAAGFTWHWATMMVPMMLPAVLLPLWRYGTAVRRWSAVGLAGLAWALAWMALAVPVYVIGALLAQALLRAPVLARCMPAVSALAGILALAWQCASWKREPGQQDDCGPVRAMSAVWYGARLGGHCIRQCAGLTAALLCAGSMETVAMAAAAAIVIVRSAALLSCAGAPRSRAGSARASG
jgi:predicted metal-binding membrane protein